MKQKLSSWADDQNYKPGDRPTPDTLRRWAEKGQIPGAYQDANKRWWVDSTVLELNHQVESAFLAIPEELRAAASI